MTLKKNKVGRLNIPDSKVVFQRTPSIPKNGIKYLQMTYLVTDLYQNKELNNKIKELNNTIEKYETQISKMSDKCLFLLNQI